MAYGMGGEMMDNQHVTIGKSFDEVIKEAAIKITGDYLLEYGESMKAAILNATGHAVDFSSKEAPPEIKLYINAFASGVANVLAAVLTGKLDLCVMKKEIDTGD